MKTLLLSNKYKKIGWLLFIPSTILGMISIILNKEIDFLNMKVFSITPSISFGEKQPYFQYIEANIGNTIIGVMFIIGSLLVLFSKEKIEDEFISKLRLNALLWAVLINYIILIIAFLFIYDVGFFTVMLFNMFTILILFIIKFHLSLHQHSKFIADEK